MVTRGDPFRVALDAHLPQIHASPGFSERDITWKYHHCRGDQGKAEVISHLNSVWLVSYRAIVLSQTGTLEDVTLKVDLHSHRSQRESAKQQKPGHGCTLDGGEFALCRIHQVEWERTNSGV